LNRNPRVAKPSPAHPLVRHVSRPPVATRPARAPLDPAIRRLALRVAVVADHVRSHQQIAFPYQTYRELVAATPKLSDDVQLVARLDDLGRALAVSKELLGDEVEDVMLRLDLAKVSRVIAEDQREAFVRILVRATAEH
jgi:hypothetical protein